LKVLYIAEGRTSEYQGDMLFHGLRSLLGSDCVDANHMWQMYADSFGDGKRSLGECWGRGFSLYGLLPPDGDVDRSDLRGKIASRYFDVVVYSLIYPDSSYLSNILAAYPANRIAFIDGGDSTDLCPERGSGIYFKRELASNYADVFPIQFAIPKEKIRSINLQGKTRLMSPHIPWEHGHTYDKESDYYDDYSQSYFALTKKKGGWDCMRHYEIIAAGTLPYFVDLENCPERTLQHFSRLDFLNMRRLRDGWDSYQGNQMRWLIQMELLQDVLISRLTTESLAKRVLERMQ
jgi:hypothetical protein